MYRSPAELLDEQLQRACDEEAEHEQQLTTRHVTSRRGLGLGLHELCFLFRFKWTGIHKPKLVPTERFFSKSHL